MASSRLPLMLALLAGGVAGAKDAGGLEVGKSAYRRLDFERCVRVLQDAQRTLTAPSDLVEREVYLGLCEAALGHTRLASAHFDTALALDPHSALPANSSPKVASLFELAQDRASPPPAMPQRMAPLAPAAPVPALVALSPAPEPAPARRPRVAGWVPWTLGGFAVAGGACFAGFGLAANANARAANSPRTFPDDSARLGGAAQRQAVGANVGLGVGIAGLVAMTVVLLVNHAPGGEQR